MKNIQRIVSVVLTILTVMALLVVPATTVSAAEAGKKEWKTFDELVEEKGYVNGIQQPWFVHNSTGNCIGKSITSNYGTSNYTDAMFYEVFKNSKAMGFDIVQLWMTYQFGGILFDSECQVIGIEPTYKENLSRVFEIAEECGIYLCLGIVNHTESSTYVNGKYRYEELCRFMHNEKQTKLFVDNWLTPVLEMTKKHDNIIMANVFVEPEANGGRWGIQTGASWENLSKFMTTVNETIHKLNPRITTFAGATGDVNSTFKYYEDIDFDCYGYDFYSDGKPAHDTSELFLNKPLVYGEFGISDSSISLTRSDEFMTSYFGNYFDTVVENGIKAGFYWYYGFPGGAQGVTDDKNRLRPFTWAVRAWSLDAEYAKTGYEGIDAPAFMYSTSEAIRFFGSRGASAITVERSKDGKAGWKKVLTFDPNDPEAVKNYEFGSMMYEWIDPDVKEGETWHYRAVAADADGKTATSETISLTADIVTCGEEDNLIKNGGFENGPLKIRNKVDGSIGDGVDGWIICNQTKSEYDMTHYKNGEAAHSGKGSVYQITKLHQAVTLKPNTDYTFTFHYKYDEVEGYWNSMIAFLTGYAENSDADPGNKVNSLVGSIRPLDKNKHGDWVRHTVKFNSGDVTDTRIMFYAWHGGAQQNEPESRVDWYIDDVYLFETAK